MMQENVKNWVCRLAFVVASGASLCCDKAKIVPAIYTLVFKVIW